MAGKLPMEKSQERRSRFLVQKKGKAGLGGDLLET